MQETPTLVDAAPARRELLLLAAATLQQLAHAEKPSAPTELCAAITENLRAEDFTDLRISLALAQAANAVLAKDAVFTPPLPSDIPVGRSVLATREVPRSDLCEWKLAVGRLRRNNHSLLCPHVLASHVP